MGGMGFSWPTEAVDRLRVLFAEGTSDTETAKILGKEFPGAGFLSRSSVIGKRHRLGLVVDNNIVEARREAGNRSLLMPTGEQRAKYERRIERDKPRVDKSVWDKAGRPPGFSLPQVAHNITMKAEAGKPVRDFSLDIPDFKCEPVTLMDLEPHMCRWPMDAGGYCGRPRVEGEWFPYCEHHVALGRRRDYTPRGRRVA